MTSLFLNEWTSLSSTILCHVLISIQVFCKQRKLSRRRLLALTFPQILDVGHSFFFFNEAAILCVARSIWKYYLSWWPLCLEHFCIVTSSRLSTSPLIVDSLCKRCCLLHTTICLGLIYLQGMQTWPFLVYCHLVTCYCRKSSSVVWSNCYMQHYVHAVPFLQRFAAIW